MSIGLVVIIAIVVWFVLSVRSNQARQLAERRSELETWEQVERDQAGTNTISLHFPSMRLRIERMSFEPDLPDGKTEYEARRRASGGWESKLTQESWRAELAEAEEKATGGVLSGMWKERAEELREGPKWTAVGDSMTSAIEVAYQRYIHQRP